MKFQKLVKADENFNVDVELSKCVDDIKNSKGFDIWVEKYTEALKYVSIEDLSWDFKQKQEHLKRVLNDWKSDLIELIDQYKGFKQVLENAKK